MIMLDFEKHPMKLQHINVRDEHHGELTVIVLDLKITFDVPNTALDQLSPTLRESLFAPDPKLGNLLEDGHRPHVKNPELGTLKWAGRFKPVSLYLHLGQKTKDDILLAEATADKILVDPKEGGTCSITMRLQVRPTVTERGRLTDYLRQEIKGTLNTSEAIDVSNEDAFAEVEVEDE
jgi:hypothetical protein